MLAESPDPHRQTFQEQLNKALICGQRPWKTPLLGPMTWSAIDAVACAHPEASADHIANAYDAYADEQD
ncbi:MAG: hypothetical protein HYZ38_18230 [Mycobacterium sp.]|nr:hypothetical protein [Mycobacterium sp.]